MFILSTGLSVVSAKQDNPFQSPVILAHYTSADHQQVSAKKLSAINYFFSELTSFNVIINGNNVELSY